MPGRCYAINALCLVYVCPKVSSTVSTQAGVLTGMTWQLWVLPGNSFLFEACYGLTLGSLGT